MSLLVSSHISQFLRLLWSELNSRWKENFSDNLAVFWNPGEVFYRAGDARIILPIWSGETNSDENYSPLPAGVFYRPSAYEAALIATGKAIAGEITFVDGLLQCVRFCYFRLGNW